MAKRLGAFIMTMLLVGVMTLGSFQGLTAKAAAVSGNVSSLRKTTAVEFKPTDSTLMSIIRLGAQQNAAQKTLFSIIDCTGDGTINPNHEPVCPYGDGIHYMRSSGWGILYRGSASGSHSLVFSGGCAWQCSKCKEVIVTQYDPLTTGTIGYWATWDVDYTISEHGCVMCSNSINHTSGASIYGYNFMYR